MRCYSMSDRNNKILSMQTAISNTFLRLLKQKSILSWVDCLNPMAIPKLKIRQSVKIVNSIKCMHILSVVYIFNDNF